MRRKHEEAEKIGREFGLAASALVKRLGDDDAVLERKIAE